MYSHFYERRYAFLWRRGATTAASLQCRARPNTPAAWYWLRPVLRSTAGAITIGECFVRGVPGRSMICTVALLLLFDVEGTLAGVNGVMAPSSGGGPATLTAGYPVQPTTHLATHALPPAEHTSTIAPQFAGLSSRPH